MKKQRVKAFTILEVTVTMLIAALLIGITFSAYLIVIKSYHSFHTRNDDMAVLVNLDHLLRRDFEQADIILKDPAGISLKRADILIKYEFNPDFIVRNGAGIDTFKVNMHEITTTFEDIPVIEEQAAEEPNRIDALGFNLVFQNEKIPYHYYKPYSSANLIQRNPNAVN